MMEQEGRMKVLLEDTRMGKLAQCYNAVKEKGLAS